MVSVGVSYDEWRALDVAKGNNDGARVAHLAMLLGTVPRSRRPLLVGPQCGQ